MSIGVEQAGESASSPAQAAGVDYPRRMRLRPPLALEIAAARGVAALSRRLGAGGGTTIPGKLLAELDPNAIDRLPARLTAGTADVSATKGKTTTPPIAVEILPPRHQLPATGSGAHFA